MSDKGGNPKQATAQGEQKKHDQHRKGGQPDNRRTNTTSRDVPSTRKGIQKKSQCSATAQQTTSPSLRKQCPRLR
jgi:hypothetical protein